MHVTLHPLYDTEPCDPGVNKARTVEQYVLWPTSVQTCKYQTAMHADDLAILSGTFIIPKFSYGMWLNIFGKKKIVGKKKRKYLKYIKNVYTEWVDNNIMISSPGRCV